MSLCLVSVLFKLFVNLCIQSLFPLHMLEIIHNTVTVKTTLVTRVWMENLVAWHRFSLCPSSLCLDMFPHSCATRAGTDCGVNIGFTYG